MGWSCLHERVVYYVTMVTSYKSMVTLAHPCQLFGFNVVQFNRTQVVVLAQTLSKLIAT